MGAKRGRARELADLVEKPVKDYDPEADVLPSDDDDRSADEASDNEPAGTEHYVAVGKSKLRRHEPLNLGPHYRGTRVSREALEAEDDEEDDEEVEGEDLDEDEEEEGEDGSSDYEDAREQFDDPDAADLEADQQGHEDDEIDSDDAVGEADWEEFKKFANGRSKSTAKKSGHAKRPTAADFMGSDSEQDDQEEAGEEEDEDDDEESEEEEESDDLRMNGLIDDEAEESEDDDLDLSDAQDGLSDEDSADSSEDDESEDSHSELEEGEEEETGKKSKSKSKRSSDSGIAASVREMMGEQSVVKSLLKNVDADVQKGKAVHRQRKGFDALLNVRIRLQKSIVAVNSFGYADKPEDQTVEPYEAAERSALQLWNALDDFRATIHKGKKRKHADTDDTSTSALWDRMEVHEKYQSARRKQVLEKWSRDAKKTSITAGSGNRFTSTAEKPLTVMLSAELDAPERLIKRTRTPRSCAPYQVARKINEDASIYDDADFYQCSVMKELVDQRSGDGSGTGLQAATIRYAAAKEAKAKRHVDTKASKGRKMRFVPLPKLQNFMAPEDRRGWEQSAIDRFFGTLFGQKMVLNEEEAESSDEEMGGVSVEDHGLRLFRN